MHRASRVRRRGVAAASSTARVERESCAPPHSATRGDASARGSHIRTSLPGWYLLLCRSLVLHSLQKSFILDPLHTHMHTFHHKLKI